MSEDRKKLWEAEDFLRGVYTKDCMDFMIRACNNHDKLVEAVKEALGEFGELGEGYVGENIDVAHDILTAALADVEKEKPNVIDRLKQKAAEQAEKKETP